jgi:hypothetical protein
LEDSSASAPRSPQAAEIRRPGIWMRRGAREPETGRALRRLRTAPDSPAPVRHSPQGLPCPGTPSPRQNARAAHRSPVDYRAPHARLHAGWPFQRSAAHDSATLSARRKSQNPYGSPGRPADAPVPSRRLRSDPGRRNPLDTPVSRFEMLCRLSCKRSIAIPIVGPPEARARHACSGGRTE